MVLKILIFSISFQQLQFFKVIVITQKIVKNTMRKLEKNIFLFYALNNYKFFMQSHIHKPKDLKITHMGGINCGTIMINHEYMKHLPKKIITGQH